MSWKCNGADQQLDVLGSINQTDTLLPLTDESSQLGAVLSGQTGSSATITASASTATITGLTGLTAASVGNFLQIEGATNPSNNGTWLIVDVTGATTAEIALVGGVSEGPSTFTWTERQPYSLEDDLNYTRTDRAAIKGVPYDSNIPTYYQCTDQTAPIDANLANIAGKTTDAKVLVDNFRFQSLLVSPGNTFVTLTSVGNLKHADSIDVTGVPINDGYDIGNDEATFVAITDDDGYATELTVISDQVGGAEEGWRIYGRTRAGVSTSPNSVEIEFRSIPLGGNLSASQPYTWESGQPTEIGIIIGYRTCLDNLDEVALRKLLIFGIIYGGESSGGSGANLPSPTEYGQFLFAQDATQFIQAVPVVNDEGLIMVDENGKVVAVGI